MPFPTRSVLTCVAVAGMAHACASHDSHLRRASRQPSPGTSQPRPHVEEAGPAKPDDTAANKPASRDPYAPPPSPPGTPPAWDESDDPANAVPPTGAIFDPKQAADQAYTRVVGQEFAVNASREASRAASAAVVETPVITELAVGDRVIWRADAPSAVAPRVMPGEVLQIRGKGFGAGVDVDYAKVLIGNTRLLERDLTMYEGKVDLLRQLFYEGPKPFDRWPAAIVAWTPTRVTVKIPPHARSGLLQISVQKRVGANPSLTEAGRPHAVTDPMTERIAPSDVVHESDVISVLSAPRDSNAVALDVDNPSFAALRDEGERIFWGYDFNIGLTHWLRGLDWDEILAGKAKDPVTGKAADPRALFGAVPLAAGAHPAAADGAIAFDPYPIPMPLQPIFGSPLLSGTTRPTGYVGYVHAQARNVYSLKSYDYTGFACASCHARAITYEDRPGHSVSRIFPGLPNERWSMKWNVLGKMKGVKGFETGPDGRWAYVDKTQLIYAIPPGTGEHSVVRHAGDGSKFGNDHLFSPIAFPIITKHTPVRRSLSHSEIFAGFEGTYIHAEEPDGAIGAMRAPSLQALTAYMGTLDADNELLNDIGLHRWLKAQGALADVDGASEGQFVQAGRQAFPRLMARVARGRAVFARDCESCHQPNHGTWTDENMLPLTTVGTYFSPTVFQLEAQSIRTAILKNLWWVKDRGLLHDGHVRGERAIEDLIDPERCREGSALYDRLYVLGPQTFKVPVGNAYQEKATSRHAYFVKRAGDDGHLYWDYQGMRKAFGIRELGRATPLALPAAPHPWCVKNSADVADAVAFLLTL